MSAQDKICSENDQTLVEICTVEYFGSDICQIKLGLVQIKSAWKMSYVRLLFHALLWVFSDNQN